MTRLFRTKTPSRRWPLQLFYKIDLTDLAKINSWILCKIHWKKYLKEQISSPVNPGTLNEIKTVRR